MPEWLAAILVGAAVALIGWVLRRGYTAILEAIKEIRDDLKAVIRSQAELARDCVTWEEFNKLRADVTHHSTEIAVIKTNCEGKHGK